MALALLLAALAAPAAAQSVAREVLGSGLTVVIEEHHSTPAVEVRVAVRAAPLYEGPLLGSGASLLLQRLLVTSAESDLPADELRRQIAALGNHFVATTEVAYSSYAISTTSDRTGEALALIAGMLENYAYTTSDLQRERGALLARAAAAPSAQDLLASILYRVHPARLPIAGLPRMMEQLTPELMRRYQAARYTAANTVVAVVGNVNTDEVRRLVEQAFAKYPIGGFQSMPLPEEAPQFAPRFATGRGDGASPRVVLAWRTEAMQHPDVPALLVLAQALGDDRRGALERALAATAAVDIDVDASLTVDQPGWLSVAFTAPAADRAAIEQTVRATLADVAARGLSPEDLAAARRATIRHLASAIGNVEGIADDLVRWELSAGDPGYGQAFADRVASVQVEDLERVARRYAVAGDDARTCTVVLRPPQEQPGATGAAAAPTGVLPPETMRLEHGVRALVRQLDEAPLVEIRVTLGGGAAADPEGQPGASALLANAMARACEGRDSAAVERLLDERGMTLAASADARTLSFTLTCLPDDVDVALELAVDLLTRPALAQEDVDAARARLARQLDHAAQQWDRRLLADLRRIVFAGVPAAREPLGRKDALSAIDRAAVAAQYRRLAVGGNAVISVYGRCEAVRVGERLDELLKRHPLPAGDAPTSAPSATGADVAPLTVSTQDGAAAAVALGWSAPVGADRERDEAPLAVLSALLAGVGQPSGRVNQALQAVESRPRLSATHDSIGDGELWVLYGQVDANAVEPTERIAREQVGALARQLALPEGDPQGLSDAELGAAKATCITALTLAQEDQAAAAAKHAATLLAHGDVARELDLVERLRAVGAADLARVAGAWLTREPVIVLHRPRGDDAAVGAARSDAARPDPPAR